jgi:hypothetical protein
MLLHNARSENVQGNNMLKIIPFESTPQTFYSLSLKLDVLAY